MSYKTNTLQTITPSGRRGIYPETFRIMVALFAIAFGLPLRMQAEMNASLGCSPTVTTEYRTASTNGQKCGFDTYLTTTPPRRYQVETITPGASLFSESAALVSGSGGGSKASACPGTWDFDVSTTWSQTTLSGYINVWCQAGYGYPTTFSDSISDTGGSLELHTGGAVPSSQYSYISAGGPGVSSGSYTVAFTPIANLGSQTRTTNCGTLQVSGSLTNLLGLSVWTTNSSTQKTLSSATNSAYTPATQTYTLSSEYTTAAMESDARAALESIAPGGWTALPQTAMRNLAANETSITVRKMQARLTFPSAAQTEYILYWEEVETHDDLTVPIVTRRSKAVTGAYGSTVVTTDWVLPPAKNGNISILRAWVVLAASCAGCTSANNNGANDDSGWGHPAAPAVGSGTVGDPATPLSLNLGGAGFGESAGLLEIRRPDGATNWASRDAMNFIGNTNYSTLLRDSVGLRQILSPQGLTDISDTGSFGYTVSFFGPSDITTLGSNGLYQTSGGPYATWTLTNLDASASSSAHVRLIETRGSRAYTNLFNWDDATQTLEVITGNGGRKELRQKSWNSATTNEIETHTILETAGNRVMFKEVFKRQQFSWGLGLVEHVVDPDGAALRSTYTYDSYGRLTNLFRGDGRWEAVSYDASNRVYRIYSSFKNSTNAALSRWITYYYDPSGVGFTNDASEPFVPGRVTEAIYDASEAGNRYLMRSNDVRKEIVCQDPGKTWSYTNNLVTTRTFYSTNGAFAGRPRVVDLANGTRRTFVYATNATQMTTTITEGEPDPGNSTNVLSGTKTVTVVGIAGEVQSRQTYFFTAGGDPVLTGQETYTYLDDLKRSHQVTYLNGTTRTVQYSCCDLDLTEDVDGTLIQYFYNDLKRLVAVRNVSLGLLVTNQLDIMGRVCAQWRQGASGIPMLRWAANYDGVGRVTQETNALNAVTSHGYWFDSVGQRVHVATNQDGGTVVTTVSRDGEVSGVSGSATFPRTFSPSPVGTGGEVIRMTRPASDGGTNEWVDVFIDIAGRRYKSSLPGNGPNQSVRISYNNKGQVWRQQDADSVTTLFRYNPRGELEYTALDLNRDNLIDYGATDRINRAVTDIITNGSGVVVWRTQTYVWNNNGSAASNLLSTVETSVDGFKQWRIFYCDGASRTNRSEVACNPAQGILTLMEIAPDGSYTVGVQTHGRTTSVTDYDPTSQFLRQVAYAYDEFGRQQTVTDSRSGSTSYTYNNADQVISVTTPSPGGGQDAQTTTVSYDLLGRVIEVVQPDGGRVTNRFALTGLLTNTVGSRIYPVNYTYDAQGRVRTMTTWTNGASNLGAAATTWNYDTKGWLASKRFQDGIGPDYSYTPGGRLSHLIWARTNGSTRFDIYLTYNYAGENDYVNYPNYSYWENISHVKYGYDRRGRLSAITNSTTAHYWMLAYNQFGQVTSESHSGGVLSGLTMTNIYDTLGRRTTNGVMSGSTWLTQSAYSYDAASRLATASQPDANLSVAYSYVTGTPLVSQMQFQQGGNTRLTTTKSYDNLDRLTAISSTPSYSGEVPALASYQYNVANQRTRNTSASGSYWQYQYDALGQVISGKRYWSDGTLVAGQQFEYGFDDIGNRTFARAGGHADGNNLRPAGHTANLLNQYTTREVPGAVDVTGVALVTNAVTVDGVTAYRRGEYFWREVPVTNTSAAAWQNVTVSSGDSNVTGNVFLPKTPEAFQYDADGNLTNDGRWTFKWDGENRLLSMVSNTNTPSGSRRSLKFSYDWQGRRISKVVSNWTGSAWSLVTSNKFLYDGWNLVAELNGTNGLVRSYLWGSDISGGDDAGGVGGLLAVRTHGTGAGTNFVGMDGNGNVTTLVDATDGTVKATYDYGPFGELVRADGLMAKANPFRFSTKYQDDESDLTYYGLRYYRADTSRWLNRDPIGENGGPNLYAFVGNDGVNQVDRLGMVSSLNFLTPAELAWILGSGAAIDAGMSIGMQRLTRDPCRDQWLDWGQVGKDVGVGAALNIATLGLYKGAQLYKAGRLARALEEATELGAKGHYDELAEMVAKYGDDFGDSLANYKRAKAATTSFNAAADAGKLGVNAAEGGLFAQYGITPGKGFNPNVASAIEGKSFITYGFKNAQGEVVYVGRASGTGTPLEVLQGRLAKGHDHFNNSLTPFIADVQKSSLANKGAEEFFIQGYRELGAPLSNIDEALSFANRQRSQKSLLKLDAFFEDLYQR